MIQSNIPVNANIQRFEATYTKQVAKDKTHILGMRIAAGVSGVLAVGGFIATSALIFAVVGTAVAVSFVALPVLAIVVTFCLAGVNVALSAKASKMAKDQRSLIGTDMRMALFLPWVSMSSLGALEKGKIELLGKYGLITEETCKEFVAFHNRYSVVYAHYLKKDKDADFQQLSRMEKEFVEILRPKILGELPLMDKTYADLKEYHDRYPKREELRNPANRQLQSELDKAFNDRLMPCLMQELRGRAR